MIVKANIPIPMLDYSHYSQIHAVTRLLCPMMRASAAVPSATQDLVLLKIGLGTRNGMGVVSILWEMLGIAFRHLDQEGTRMLRCGRERQRGRGRGGEGLVSAEGR